MTPASIPHARGPPHVLGRASVRSGAMGARGRAQTAQVMSLPQHMGDFTLP